MMKICFEGPSGIGKTTISNRFEKDCKVIPEVNALFRSEENEGGWWYYQKQIERYQLSELADCAIFDGDIFQPLWYNWSYNYPEGYFSLEEMFSFYQRELQQGNMDFPDLYIIFKATEQELRLRKERDPSRQRRNFEKHLKLIETQPQYFGFMQTRFPGLVKFMAYDSTSQVESELRQIIQSLTPGIKYDSEKILQTMADWLAQHKPAG